MRISITKDSDYGLIVSSKYVSSYLFNEFFQCLDTATKFNSNKKFDNNSCYFDYIDLSLKDNNIFEKSLRPYDGIPSNTYHNTSLVKYQDGAPAIPYDNTSPFRYQDGATYSLYPIFSN